MFPKRFSTLSVATGLAAFAVAGCGGDKQDKTTTSATAQAPAATTPAATTPAATAPVATTPAAIARARRETAKANRRAVALMRAPVRRYKSVEQAVASTDHRSGAVAFTMKGTVTTGSQSEPLSARGVVDRQRQRGAFTTSMKVVSQVVTSRQIFDKRQLYLRSPVFAGKLPGGKSWLKVDVKAEDVPGFDLKALGVSGPTQDPMQGLDYLPGAGKAQRIETAKVNGVATTQYRVQVDLKRAAKRNSSRTGKRSIGRLISALGGPTTLPVDLWIDGDHLVRRQHVTYNATVAGVRSAYDITTDYTAYGARLDAQPPADGDTFDGLGQKNVEDAAEAQKAALEERKAAIEAQKTAISPREAAAQARKAAAEAAAKTRKDAAEETEKTIARMRKEAQESK